MNNSNGAAGEVEYVGFWMRFVASVIDSILIALLVYPLMSVIFGWDNVMAGNVNPGVSLLLQLVLPAIAIIVFWIYRSATPGKMVVGARIVNARTLGKASTGQLIGRYFGYYLSTIVFFLGFLWIAFDKRKQGWHDKLAGTVVIKKR
ncbi:MAG TPA: RDD family protein [Gammaproteobacteria bacterium]|jgi:uncharacterized RDD family membrane protein YckC